MKTSFFYLLLTAVILPVPLPAQTAGDFLTRQDIVRLTLTNQPQIIQAEQYLAAAEARVEVKRTALGPEVEGVGDYTRLGPVASLSSGSETTRLYPYDNYDVHIELQQTIFDFGKRKMAIASAEASRQAAGDYIDFVRLSLAYQAVAAFNNVLTLQNTITVIDSQIAALQQHAVLSTKRIQAGTATGYDTLTTQVRIAVATNDRIDALRALNSQMIMLHQLTGLPDSQPINLKGDFAEISPVPALDSLIRVAEEQRSELILARDAERVAEVHAQLARMGDQPSLSLAATTGFKNGYFPGLNNPKANFTAGILFRMPLFNGHRTRYEEAAARDSLEAARAHTADVRRQVLAEMKQALSNIQLSLTRINTADVQIRQAQQAIAMATTRYEAGVITNVELLDVQTALLQTRLIRLRAEYDYTVGLAALDRATGHRIW